MPTLAQTEALLQVQERLEAVPWNETSVTRRLADAQAREALLAERQELIASIDGDGGDRAGSFWATVLAAHGGVAARIGLRDARLLGALADVSVEEMRGAEGFRLVFSFREGDAFEAGKVLKEFITEEVGGATRGRVVGDGIGWKDGVASRGGPFFEWLESSDDVYGLGSAIRRHVVPKAVDLYFGTGHEKDSLEGEDEEDITGEEAGAAV